MLANIAAAGLMIHLIPARATRLRLGLALASASGSWKDRFSVQTADSLTTQFRIFAVVAATMAVAAGKAIM